MLSIIEAINDPNLFRPLFKDLGSWAAWQVFLKALLALPMTEAEQGIFRECTGREALPGQPAREAWVVAGRRSGKSFMAALIATYLGCFKDYKQYLSTGERAHVLCLAADRKQARIIFRYIQGFLTGNLILAQMIERETAESIDLTSRVSIEVATCSYRSIRGFTAAAAVICDEIAFWRDDTSVDPATEVLRAVRPALATIPDSLLLCISSPYSQSGPLWQTFKDHYGQDSDVLVWRASTRLMNPTISQGIIDRDLALDPEAARSEWDAEFRTDLESFLSPEAIEAAIIQGRYELSPMPGTSYTAFVDPSGGRADAATLAIAHRQGDIVVLDLARRWPSPHDPAQVVKEMAGILKSYGVVKVTGDRYAGSWPEQEFRKYGISYEGSIKDKSTLYLEFLPLILSGRVELLENKTLFNELRQLERRARSGGRDLVDHLPRGHDDLANAAAGACVLSNVEFRFRIRWI